MSWIHCRTSICDMDRSNIINYLLVIITTYLSIIHLKILLWWLLLKHAFNLNERENSHSCSSSLLLSMLILKNIVLLNHYVEISVTKVAKQNTSSWHSILNWHILKSLSYSRQHSTDFSQKFVSTVLFLFGARVYLSTLDECSTVELILIFWLRG